MHATGRIYPHHAVGSKPHFAQFLANLARFPHHFDKCGTFFWAAHRWPTPNWRNQTADFEAVGGHFIGQAFDAVVGSVEVIVRVEKTQINAVELNAVHFGGGGHFEHGVECNGWFRIGAFAHDARPSGVVEFGVIIY